MILTNNMIPSLFKYHLIFLYIYRFYIKHIVQILNKIIENIIKNFFQCINQAN